MAETMISWSEVVWNPLRGCTRVSPGCGQGNLGGCYAEKMAYRFSGEGQPYEGLVKLTSHGPRWTGEVRLVPDKVYEPLGWKKPRKVFVNSMSDLFHEAVPDEFIDKVFAVMALSRQHTFQVLTKRAERLPVYLGRLAKSIEPLEKCAREFGRTFKFKSLEGQEMSLLPWPIPNVHIGVSVENQKCADERIPHLLKAPAAVRWLSCEPLLEEVDLRHIQFNGEVEIDCLNGTHGVLRPHRGTHEERIGWVVIGCESGPNKRRFENDWARKIIADCKAAGVPVHVKQIRVAQYVSHHPNEWPEDLRVREDPADASR